jgi:hypothetical protein
MTPELEQKLVIAIGKSWANDDALPEYVNPEDLDELYEYYYTIFDDNGGWSEWAYGPNPVTIPELGSVEIVYEGRDPLDPDVMYVVIRVDGKLFKKSGYYSSYSGGEWDDDWREVEEKKKEITIYE